MILVIVMFVSVLSIQAQWTQIGNNVNGEAIDDHSGISVSLSSDGTVMAIGAKDNDGNGDNSGHVRVYELIDGTWTKIGNDIDGEGVGDSFGHSVSLNSDGSILAVGAPNNSDNESGAGHVRIFENLEGTWTQIGNDIDGSVAGDNLGYSVDLSADGSIVALSAIGNGAGYVKVFKKQSGIWVQVGQNINGEFNDDKFGYSISLNSDGTIIAIGATENLLKAGHVRVFENQEGVWTQIGSDIDGEAVDDRSGCSVSLSSNGSILAVGAYGNNLGTGHVRVYKNQNSSWTQIGDDIDGEEVDDWFGWAVDLSADGSVVAIGAQYNDGESSDAGHARVFFNHNETWTLIGNDINGEAVDDRFGVAVCLSSNGSIISVGAQNNDGSGSNAGSVRVFGYPPYITSHPTHIIDVCPSQEVSYTVNDKFANTYQWQVSINSGSNWSNISDNSTYSRTSTDSLVILTDTTLTDNIYRCIITNDKGSAISNSALLTLLDDIVPTISCVGNINKRLSQGETVYTVLGTEFDPVAYDDNCKVDSVYNDYNILPSLVGANFEVGDTVVKWIIVDEVGNTNFCSFNVLIEDYVGLDDMELNGISIYPNPTGKIININSRSLKIKNIEINDLSGKLIQSYSFLNQNTEIDLSNFERGIYILKIQAESKIFITKIVKK